MPIETQVWTADLAANLFPDNTFLARSINDDRYVENAQVNLPQSGAVPEVEKNRSVFPAVSVERADTTADYPVDHFSSTPTRVRRNVEIEVSFQLRADVLRDHQEEIFRQCAEDIIYQWSADSASNIIYTTGDDRETILPGATGLRKALTLADIRRAKVLFDANDIPMQGRFLALTAQQQLDLLADPTMTSKDYVETPNLITGSIARVLGFEVYTRSTVARFDSAGVKKDPSAVAAATDVAAALMWHQNFVRRAKSDVHVFAKENDPNNYGSVFSAEARSGGRKRYTNGRGVVSILEATV